MKTLIHPVRSDLQAEPPLENERSAAPATQAAPDVPLPLASTVGGVTTSDFSDIIFIYGTEGDDVISWQGGPVVIQGLGGNDQIYGPAGGNSFLSGDAGNDTLQGYGGGNSLFGGDGNDSLFVYPNGVGNNTLEGGAGDDLLYAAPGGTARLSGGDGFDTVIYGYFGATSVSVNLVDPTLNAGGAAGHTYQSIESFMLSGFDDSFIGADAGDIVDGYFGNDTIAGGGGDDALHGNRGDDHLRGDGGNDVLDGDSGNDELIGGDGNDILRGGTPFIHTGVILEPGGNDFLYGGNGNDQLDGGDGDDGLDGGAGADTLVGGDGFDTASYLDATVGISIDLTKASSTWTGDAQGDTFSSIERLVLTNFADTFRGDANANSVYGGDGNDQIFGAAGDDGLTGGNGNDIIQGGAGNDHVHGDGFAGNPGDDYLQGNAGDDVLYGDGGNDRMVGGIGNDVLIGGDGGDFLVGDVGNDIFQYAAVEESQAVTINGVSQLDQINDFTQGQDKIDLSLIDANPTLDGDQAFTFIADPAHYTGDWTGVVWQTTDARSGFVTINVSIDGDAAPEMQIYMSHPYQFTASDFIL